MSSKELVLNPISGRYVVKYGSKWQALVADGSIPPEPTIPPKSSLGAKAKEPEPLQRRIDKAAMNELGAIAVEQYDALRGVSRVEAEDLLSKFLYERLVAKTPPGLKVAAHVNRTAHERPTLAPVQGVTRSLAVPIKKHTAPSTRRQPYFLSTADTTDAETDASYGRSQVEDTEDD